MKRAEPPATEARANLAARKQLDQYLGHLAHERRLSAHTISNYRRDIETLIQLAGAGELNALEVHQIRRFVAQLHGRGLDGRSIARSLSAWRGFYRYLAREHDVKTNPCLGIRAPKAAKRLPHALSPDDAARLMTIDEDGMLALRDRAMWELFYSSGLRLSELTGLSVSDIDMRDATVRVTGKGNKTRVVPVGRLALEAIQAWITPRALLVDGGERALFVSQHRRRLSQRAVQMRLKRWAVQQGLDRSLHPHMLRHSFASHVLQSSGDLRAVQEMLGHANISTTQVYTQLDFQHLAKIYDAAHPRAHRKTK